MNNNNNQPGPDQKPDAFEQQWIDRLAERESDLIQSGDAFVQRVMQRANLAAAHESVPTHAARRAPAALGRIAPQLATYAAAAALLLAALIGWAVFFNDAPAAPSQQIAIDENFDAQQPADAIAVAPNQRPNIQLGKLIANAKNTATAPADNLTAAVNRAPQTFSIDRLFDLLDDSVPDLNEVFRSRESEEQQSRA